jgi:hypothetical protein
MRRATTTYGNTRSGYDAHVGFTDLDKSRSGSRDKMRTLPSSQSPGITSPGKAAGILKRKGHDEDGYLKSIKED